MRIGWTIWLPVTLCFAFGGQLLTIILAGPENGSATASLLLTLGFAGVAAWLLHQRRSRPDPSEAGAAPSVARASVGSAQVAPLPGLPLGVGMERRRYPRIPVDRPAEIVWHHAVREPTRLHDLSRGGARLTHGRHEALGRRGLLLVPGLNLPVPFTIVGASPATGLHIRFDLEGMGLDELEKQLQALTVSCNGADRLSGRPL
jgi:hypothetical protein